MSITLHPNTLAIETDAIRSPWLRSILSVQPHRGQYHRGRPDGGSPSLWTVWFFACLLMAAVASSRIHAETIDLSMIEGTSVDRANSVSETCSSVEVWEVSTRHLPCNVCVANWMAPKFEVYRSINFGNWCPAKLEELTSSAPTDNAVQTIFYVHGNWMTRANARDRVHIIARNLASRTPQSIRIVMMSWPSERSDRPVRDILKNAECADVQALYLGTLIRLFKNESQFSLLGFSLGCRVITGGLHVAEGGSLLGRYLPIDSEATVTRMYRVSLIAPAVDRAWLQPTQRHGMAMNHVIQMINLYNSQDPVLKRFRFIDTSSRPIAAGFAGFIGLQNAGDPRLSGPLTGQDRIKQYDCSQALGNTHDERSYFRKCSAANVAFDNLLWRDGCNN